MHGHNPQNQYNNQYPVYMPNNMQFQGYSQHLPNSQQFSQPKYHGNMPPQGQQYNQQQINQKGNNN